MNPVWGSESDDRKVIMVLYGMECCGSHEKFTRGINYSVGKQLNGLY